MADQGLMWTMLKNDIVWDVCLWARGTIYQVAEKGREADGLVLRCDGAIADPCMFACVTFRAVMQV